MPKGTGPESKKKKATIVLVDDEQSILRELKFLLGRTYQIYTFVNPEEVEDFVDQNHVDMVISDELMPEMRGSELLARIHKRHPDICKVVLSGQAEKDDIVRAVNEGHIFSFLYKPVDKQQLLNVIEKGLESRMMKLKMAQQNLELKRYSENLEKMVEEKTAQLVKAYDKLKMLDENKMSFLLYLSHEMDSSLDRIKKLAETLLNYFAFIGADLKIERKPVALKQLVDELLEDAATRIHEAEIEIHTEYAGDPVVSADPDYLRQVLKTVIDNALTYTPKGGKVSISSVPINGKTRICISDTGRGILKEDLKKIFRAFVLEPRKRHPDGFGLNLPIAKIIVISHGGRIWAESEGKDKGASFFIEI